MLRTLVRDIGLGAAKDEDIVKHALRSSRIIVTGNLGFGSTVRHPQHPGAIIVRLHRAHTSKQLNERLRSFFTSVSEDKIRDTIVIVESTRYRRRPLHKP